MHVRFGVTLEIGAPTQKYAVLGELCRLLDESGVTAVWIGDEPDLTEYLAQRFAIAGTVSEFVERVEQLAEMGATQFRFGVGGSDRNRLRRTLGDEIIPHFQ